MDNIAPEPGTNPKIYSRFLVTQSGKPQPIAEPAKEPAKEQAKEQAKEPIMKTESAPISIIGRGRGRPRIHPISTEPKKPVGRPPSRTPDEQKEYRKQYLREYKKRARASKRAGQMQISPMLPIN